MPTSSFSVFSCLLRNLLLSNFQGADQQNSQKMFDQWINRYISKDVHFLFLLQSVATSLYELLGHSILCKKDWNTEHLHMQIQMFRNGQIKFTCTSYRAFAVHAEISPESRTSPDFCKRYIL